jgi:hypothetical protein
MAQAEVFYDETYRFGEVELLSHEVQTLAGCL